jgi:large subunit ribosomal protein L22
MQIQVVSKNTGVSASKMRPLVDMVRGKMVDDALNILKFTPSPNARVVAKVIKTAANNAESYQMSPSNLKIVGISADAAETLKRYRAGARRRVSRILKRSSHITVIVDEEVA